MKFYSIKETLSTSSERIFEEGSWRKEKSGIRGTMRYCFSRGSISSCKKHLSQVQPPSFVLALKFCSAGLYHEDRITFKWKFGRTLKVNKFTSNIEMGLFSRWSWQSWSSKEQSIIFKVLPPWLSWESKFRLLKWGGRECFHHNFTKKRKLLQSKSSFDSPLVCTIPDQK